VKIEILIGLGDGNGAAVHLMDAENGSIGDAKRGLDAAVVFVEIPLRILHGSGGIAEIEGVERRPADAADAGGECVRYPRGGEERRFVPDDVRFRGSARQHGSGV
jgi:hypothetical protein